VDRPGAPWEPHWAFIKPARPALPVVKNAKWVRNPVDAFVLAASRRRPRSRPEADRRTLARRLSLDLTGLPPEPDLVEAFVADASPTRTRSSPTSSSLRRATASTAPGTGCDAARYADTTGSTSTTSATSGPIATGSSTPSTEQTFDQFTVEQLPATCSQPDAGAAHRHRLPSLQHDTNEGGTIAEENRRNYARDRVETTFWVWLGLTANCAVCHDHKFDPITQKDFYSMAAFFRNTTQGALDGNIRDTAPVLLLPKPEDEGRNKASPGRDRDRKQAVAARKKVLRAEFDKWLETAKPQDWTRGRQDRRALVPPAAGRRRRSKAVFPGQAPSAEIRRPAAVGGERTVTERALTGRQQDARRDRHRGRRHSTRTGRVPSAAG
jgi:hypothetical protein